ncbi:MAG TPA: hypothetical protein VGF59_00505 [Bryobacteraceae bacterium]|jgi:Rod binding domain-containing protein
MGDLPLIPVMSPGAPDPPQKGTSPARIRDAAEQFEALLLTQILHAARESGTGWLGSNEDASGDCTTDFAEQRFAAILAQQGGFGLAALISRGLDRDGRPPETETPART